MIQEFVTSAKAYLEVLPLITRFRLWRYIFLCGLISFLLGSSIFYWSYALSDNLGQAIVGWYPFDVGQGVISTISSFIGGITIFFGSLFLYKYIVLIVLSPLLSFISERIEVHMRSGSIDKVGFSISGMISDILRGIRISLRNVTRELLLTVLLLITGFIPMINILTTPALFLLQAYFAGFGNMDFYLERHLKMKPTVRFVNNHKGMAMGNGSVFLLILMIPVIGLILAPTFGTIAASYRVHPFFDNDENKSSELV